MTDSTVPADNLESGPTPTMDQLPVGVGREARTLVDVILTAADYLRELLEPELLRHGLNDARFVTMRAICTSASGECSQTELARRLSQSEANVSTLLERMRIDGLISREKSPLDRRRSIVRLTERGEWLLARAATDYVSRAGDLLSGLAGQEADLLTQRLDLLLDQWELELSQDNSAAVAGRIGEVTPETKLDSPEKPHAQAS